jgi:formylmethanofuran dehydrogenase subunit E
MDYGKVAASFLNLQTGEAVRISSKTRVHPPDDVNPVEFFLGIPEDELFHVARVKIHYRPEDLPGKPRNAMICPTCGEEVIDGRQVIRDSIAVCKACADGAYYELEDLNDNC